MQDVEARYPSLTVYLGVRNITHIDQIAFKILAEIIWPDKAQLIQDWIMYNQECWDKIKQTSISNVLLVESGFTSSGVVFWSASLIASDTTSN